MVQKNGNTMAKGSKNNEVPTTAVRPINPKPLTMFFDFHLLNY